MVYILVVLLYAVGEDVPHTRVERTFTGAQACYAEAARLAAQPIPAGMAGRIVLGCVPKEAA